ncbi:hypothetical protein PGTUg99_034423 [Puccinia graminis f. sp. tritici]|uniref:Uncharacterized protein n=1 Tax=Puccinia graminis f. sp. tritici TaxID=56615 RepID=A0A5B0S1E6_PUCGR|nr:hypothetical protein PGTUg99_034423 [Puccinia graminis f. sp. tritici]
MWIQLIAIINFFSFWKTSSCCIDLLDLSCRKICMTLCSGYWTKKYVAIGSLGCTI